MKFGLIGKNIGYSKSKDLFDQWGIEYKIYDVNNVEQGLELAIADKLDGFNVTKPFKLDIVKYLDCLMPDADRIKSVNCVKILNDTFIGENFDGEAFRISLQHYVDNHDDWEFDYPHKMAILGNGGVVPSILTALHDATDFATSSHEMTVFARNPKGIDEKSLDEFKAKDFDLIVNTIPDKDSLEKFLKDKEIYVPGFCISYRDNWGWATKKPFGPQKDLNCGYSSSALLVYPKLTTDDNHPDSDSWFGENWLEWYGKRHYIKTPEDVYKVQHELDLDLHLLYIDGDEKNG